MAFSSVPPQKIKEIKEILENLTVENNPQAKLWDYAYKIDRLMEKNKSKAQAQVAVDTLMSVWKNDKNKLKVAMLKYKIFNPPNPEEIQNPYEVFNAIYPCLREYILNDEENVWQTIVEQERDEFLSYEEDSLPFN